MKQPVAAISSERFFMIVLLASQGRPYIWAVEQSAEICSQPCRSPTSHMGRSDRERLSETALIVDPSPDFYRSGFSEI
jgi:hypothetical protein